MSLSRLGVNLQRYLGLFALLGVTVAFYFAAPNKFFLDIAVLAAINAIACVGLNLLIGYAGQISLGHAAFFAIGAYAPAILEHRTGVNLLVCVAASAVITGLLAFVIGRPILRLKGHYLAMATLGFGAIATIVINHETGITGGADGLNVPRLIVYGHAIEGETTWFWIAAITLLMVVWASLNLIDSAPGRMLQAVHGSEFAARSAGIDTHRVKVLTFVLSAVLACVSGSMFAQYVGYVTPDKATFAKSVELVTMVVVGGLASVYGAVVGALLLTVLPQLLTSLENYELAVFGAILVTSVVVMPRGIVPSISGAIERMSARSASK
ncbi:branched-chain amino acid ABC transporter permease [Bradyrhizobium sp. LA7.1]|uniref:branched-chain amino acid ABC transporter permease n=1 Tax=Bradyrhizobium sp. LA7.1 TaxID=3156324 RepID=UPI00339929AB